MTATPRKGTTSKRVNVLSNFRNNVLRPLAKTCKKALHETIGAANTTCRGMRSKKKGSNHLKNEAKKRRARANQKARRALHEEKSNNVKTVKHAIPPHAKIRCTRIMHGSISMTMSVHNLQVTHDPQDGGKFTTTLDSGANCHAAATKHDLHAHQPLKRGDFNVKCANGNVVSALGHGTKHMVMHTHDSKNENSKTIMLKAEKSASLA